MLVNQDNNFIKDTPNLKYNSIKLTYVSDAVHTVDVGLSGKCKAAISKPSQGKTNYITVSFTPDKALTYYGVRITQKDEDYDIDLGTRAYSAVNLPANRTHTFSIQINTDNFKYGGTEYRISLYAQNQADYS